MKTSCLRAGLFLPSSSVGLRSGLAAALMIFILVPCGMEAQMSNSSPGASAPASVAGISIIPKPSSLEVLPGAFILRADTVIVAEAGVPAEADYLAEALAPATGWKLAVCELAENSPPVESAIVLLLDPDRTDLGDEGYSLLVEAKAVTATACKPAGIFYAVQTLRQLLPPEILAPTPATGIEWKIPAVRIQDIPRFAWRGHLLDCCRHFFPVEIVKRQIDLLALHKMNRLHWHLTEDQGWRIEIKRYPKLTEVGAWRTQKDGTRYGGFYTQDEVREVVAYAASRHILVVPEIEMPGHSVAALASYPELGCTGGPYTVANNWGVFDDVYCAGNDKVFEFLENVLVEVMALFPSPYIHIGGDECPKTRWKACPKCQARIRAEGLKDEHELQSYFIKRMEKFLAKNNRRLIGWDEILEGGLAPNAIVQSWRGVKGGIAAAEDNHDVIMSPTSHCYLDYTHDAISLEKAYGFEPVPEALSPEKAKHVLGLEGNLWAEWVPDRNRLDMQVFPRLTALAEVAWTPARLREESDFLDRMKTHYRRFEVLGVNYFREGMEGSIPKDAKPVGTWQSDQMTTEGKVLEWDVTSFVDEAATYQVVIFYRRGQHAAAAQWVALDENGIEKSRDTHECWSGGIKQNVVYTLTLDAHKPGATYRLRSHLAGVGGTDTFGEIRMKKVKQ
jgi:hexosaminidase